MVKQDRSCSYGPNNDGRPLRVLTFTSLFPNAQFPGHALFVRERILALSRYCELKVMAPVPLTLPLRWLGERYYRFSKIMSSERQSGLDVTHPRFFVFPKFCKILDGLLMALSVLWPLKTLKGKFSFDVIDAHWAYPDGVAAAILSKFLGVPFVVTVRGDDINVFARHLSRRMPLTWALQSADLVLAVSRELKVAVESLGVDPQAILVSSNGVDAERFYFVEQSEARRNLGLPQEGKFLLSVGRVHLSKGHHILVEALGLLNGSFLGTKLFIIGAVDHESDGRQAIQSAITQFKLDDRVQIVGHQDPTTLRDWYNAADLFCFATEREGSANVLLEAQACGLPCLATPVGGNPEIINDPTVGMLLPGNSKAFAEGIFAALSQSWDRQKISTKGRKRTWDTVGKECVGFLNRAIYGDKFSQSVP